MAQAIKSVVPCPLCGDEISIDFPISRIATKWRDVVVHRESWAVLAREFISRRSIDEAAQALSISSEEAHRVLEFLCLEICGCRGVTCTSCLDDYRSDL